MACVWLVKKRIMSQNSIARQNSRHAVVSNLVYFHSKFTEFFHMVSVHNMPACLALNNYRRVSNIRRTLVRNKIVDHWDVVGASPIGFILDLTPGFIGLCKDNCKTRRETKVWGFGTSYNRDFTVVNSWCNSQLHIYGIRPRWVNFHREQSFNLVWGWFCNHRIGKHSGQNHAYSFIIDIIGILCGDAIRSGGRWLASGCLPDRIASPQSIPFIQYAQLRCWINSNCANCALKWEMQWFDDELFIHTCMTSPAKRADVTCQMKPEGRRPDPLLNIPRTAPGP